MNNIEKAFLKGPTWIRGLDSLEGVTGLKLRPWRIFKCLKSEETFDILIAPEMLKQSIEHCWNHSCVHKLYVRLNTKEGFGTSDFECFEVQ